MKIYLVIWRIEIEAETAEDAANRALEIQRDPESIATAFEVIDADAVNNIDLGEGG